MAKIYRKLFNIAGPCVPGEHYMLPAAERLAEVDSLIADRQYFVLHAPRQSGKTTTIQAYVDKINDEGKYHAVYCSLESAGVWTEPDEGIRKVGIRLINAMLDSGIPPLAGAAADAADAVFREMSPSGREGAHKGLSMRFDSTILVESILKSVCSALDRELVLFFDEADSLADGLLIAFLRQLRTGYISRGKSPFPRTIALIGMRNIRDYKNKARPDAETLGSASPFNIIAKALSLKDFTFSEMSALYRQHTEERGQVFEESALEAAWRWSEGQP
ncbi:MAG: ATP-binding protein, partial [Deltaproteobacteria bacterium]|nr:ATP-binding protein [Deltaproteobacteria bacterium]